MLIFETIENVNHGTRGIPTKKLIQSHSSSKKVLGRYTHPLPSPADRYSFILTVGCKFLFVSMQAHRRHKKVVLKKH
jgi:hypothetical protein